MDVSPLRLNVEPVSSPKSQEMSRLVLRKAIESARQNQQPTDDKVQTQRTVGKSNSLQPHLGQNIDIYV